MTTPYIDPNLIFAENAPVQDKPAAFSNYDKGWDESRNNDGRPLIPQMNYLTQQADLKNLYIHENGAALPYKDGIAYEENAVVVKDGVLQQWKGGVWVIISKTTHNELTGRDAAGSHPASAISFRDESVGSKLIRENVSVWDFFTESELDSYKASPATFDAYRPIQEFFTYIALNDVGTAYCSINAYISQGIKIGIAGAHATKVVNGNMQLQALNAIDTMIEREIGQDFEWIGLIYLVGHRTATSPPYVWRNRTCRIGMSTHATYENARQKWGGFRFLYFQQDGLQIKGKNTAGHYKFVRGNGNGVGLYADSRYRFETTFDSRVDSGTSSSASQRSTIKVGELPPSSILNDTNCYVVINGESYYIESYNAIESTVTVLPWIDLDYQTGSLAYCFGGLVSVKGGDSSAVSFEVIEGTNNGINLNDTSLYTVNVGMLMSQACGFGYNLGGQVGAANLGGVITSYYAEGNHLDILMTSTAVATKVIENCYTVQAQKIKTISFRSAANLIVVRNISAMRIGYNGKMLTGIKNPSNSVSTVDLDFFTKNIDGQTFRNNAQVFTLPNVNTDVNRLTGIDSASVKVIGSSSNAIPNSVTFRSLEGATINGSSSDVVFSGFSAPPQFDIYAQIATNNYIVVCREVQKGFATATYDPPSLAAAGTAGDTVTTTVTLTGVTVGSVVQAAFSQYNADIEISASVSAANTVTVKFKNTGAAAVDLASGTLTVKLL